jgi:hypothetical protein
MRIWAFLAAMMCGLLAFGRPAGAVVSIHIDLSSQRMRVTNGAGQSYDWPVSTARSGYATPRGSYRPYSLQTMHYSRKYDMSPMPHSIFFRGGYAIHGTYSVRELGRPASHGCVRLAPGHAKALFMMVKRESASITISGTPPGGAHVARGHGGHKVKAAKLRGNWRAVGQAGRARSFQPVSYGAERRAPQQRRWLGNPAYYGY